VLLCGCGVVAVSQVSGSVGVLRAALGHLALLSGDGWSCSVLQPPLQPPTATTGGAGAGEAGAAFSLAVCVPPAAAAAAGGVGVGEVVVVGVPLRSFVACALHRSAHCLDLVSLPVCMFSSTTRSDSYTRLLLCALVCLPCSPPPIPTWCLLASAHWSQQASADSAVRARILARLGF
jgi:hypothetical protein